MYLITLWRDSEKYSLIFSITRQAILKCLILGSNYNLFCFHNFWVYTFLWFLFVIAEYSNATIVIAVEFILLGLLILLAIIFSVFLR